MISKLLNFSADGRMWPLVLGSAGISALLVGGMIGWRYYKERNLPPGPRQGIFSTVGSLNSDENLEYDLHELARQYGDVFSVKLNNQILICLASETAMKETFLKESDAYAYRPMANHGLAYFSGMKDDIFGTQYDTKEWNQNKAFLTGCLRTVGFGQTQATSEKVLDQIEILFQYLENSGLGKPICLRDIIPKVTANVILQIILNINYDYDDPKLIEYLEVFREWLGTLNDAMLLDTVPGIVARIFYRNVVKSMREINAKIHRVLGAEVDAHVETFDENHLRDFVDEYILKRGSKDKKRLIDNVTIFIPDACDTLAIAIEWVILYLTTYQDVQQEMFTEIERITGGNRNVTWSDRNKLPYSEAAIREVLRLTAPFPITAPHNVMKERTYRGYRIPTNVSIYGLIYTIHRDPQVFPQPDVYNPRRFLDDDGSLIKSDGLVHFSMGRRKCLGEQLTQIEMFLIVTNLIQRFDFQFESGNRPSLKPSMDNFVRGPQIFSVVLNKRVKE